MTWHPLERLLHPALTRAGVANVLTATVVCQAAMRAITQECDPATVRQSHILSYRNGVLLVGVSGANYAQDIRLHQHAISKSLARQFGRDVVARIMYRIGES